ncbi:unnamed protein product [Lupinus luteus]|uniref:Uncharacterized protein n=1 Tax=Lupinus luteus TaxID=3873 RepID=A0AAV1WEM7_LUPLU
MRETWVSDSAAVVVKVTNLRQKQTNPPEWRENNWFRTSLFQGGSGDSTSPGGRVLRKEVDHGLSKRIKIDFSWVDARAVNGDGL